jgi:phosphoesterase RecJ-like protein
MSSPAELSRAFAVLLPELVSGPVVIAGHARPDGDCIGSQVALANVLLALGCPAVTCVNVDPVPRRLEFLAGEHRFVTPGAVPATVERVLFVDCADELRPGAAVKERFGRPFLNVDHHVSNDRYAEHNFLDVTASATCEILTGIFRENAWPVSGSTAQALFAGIATDTGQFRFGSTTQRTFELAAWLVAQGADPAAAGFELYERESAGKVQLLQRFLASFEHHVNGRVCIGYLSDGIFEETGTSIEDTEGMVDYARSIDGVDVGVLIEQRGDAIKASLRSHNPAFRMDQIAARFGGGGHACAAGLNLRGRDLGEFRDELVAALDARLAPPAAGQPS